MRRGSWKVLVLALIASAAWGVPARAQQGAAPARKKAVQAPAQPALDANDPRMKQLLAAWEQQSSKLKTLDVMIHRLDRSPAWGDEEFKGRALLQAPNLAWLDFKKPALDEEGKPKLDSNRKPMFVDEERVICTGSEVWQFKPKTKQIFVFPLDKKNKQKALEEGPLPFLFNMKAAEAEARYQMALVNETKTSFSISVVPRLQIDQDAFSKAFIVLDRTTYLPNRIFLISPDGKSTKDFRLTEVVTNKPIEPVNFKGYNPGRPWELIRDPGGNVQAPQAAQNPRPRMSPNRQATPATATPRNAAIPPRRPPAN